MKTLEELKKSQNSILILHYACTDVTKSPVIITSISIKDYSTGQTLSFSFDEYGDEKNLLSAFVTHMKKYQNHIIVTWNQKSSTYGIQHMQRRCKDLGIDEDFPIDLEQVTDLDDIFTEKYGRGYVDDPKLRCLAEVNDITLQNFVDGFDEIRLFEEKEYKKIENSTNRKVNVIADYLSSAFNNKLRVSRTKEKNKKDKEDASKSSGRKLGKKTIIVIGAVASVLVIVVSLIAIYEFAEERIDGGRTIESTEGVPETSSKIQPQINVDSSEPFLSLQIIPHTDMVTEQSFPAIISGDGSVTYEPSKVDRGPVVIYENLTSAFTIYVHNDGPGIVSIDRYVINVISDDKSLQPVTIKGKHLGDLLEPGSESLEINAEITGDPRMKPTGIIDFEVHHADGKISKSIEYEYFEKRPFN